MVGLAALRSRGKKQKNRKKAPPSISDDKECFCATAPRSTKKKGIEAPPSSVCVSNGREQNFPAKLCPQAQI